MKSHMRYKIWDKESNFKTEYDKNKYYKGTNEKNAFNFSCTITAQQTQTASCRCNGTGLLEVGIHKDPCTASCVMDAEGDRRLQTEAQGDAEGRVSATATDDSAAAVLSKSTQEEEKLMEGHDGQGSSCLGEDCPEKTPTALCL